MDHLSDFQTTLLQTFKEFAKFCETNGLTYYAAFGTLLGVIRHEGFIPWDDDIDVWMMRKDYEKLIALRPQLQGTHYRITMLEDGHHPYLFAKFYTTDATVWEYRQFPFIMGPWIDIFPLDEWTPGSERDSDIYDRFHESQWKYRKALSWQTWGEIAKDFVTLNGLNGPVKLVKQCLYRPFKQAYFKKSLQCIEQVKSIKGTHLKPYSEVKRRCYEKDWFTTAESRPFEDTTMLVPNGWHELLTDSFGDYMTLPPPEKRVANHNYYFVDLKRSMTVDQILSDPRLKTERAPLSLKILLDEFKHQKGFQ